MLTRLYADNFRTLVNFELRPERLSLLLGDNGSGKSSAFEVLAILSDVLVRGVGIRNYFRFSRTEWDKRPLQRFEIDLKGPEGVYRYTLVVGHGLDGEPYIHSELVALNGEPLFKYADGKVHLFSDDHEPGPVFPYRNEYSFLASDTSHGGKLGWFKSFIAGISIFQINPFEFGVSHAQEQPFLARFGQNFSAFWDHLGDAYPELRTVCEEELKNVIPGFSHFKFLRMGQQKQLFVSLEYDDGRSYELPALNLSEGQRALAILYASILGLPRGVPGSLLCFDEPDNFVALSEIQPWLQLVRDQLQEGTNGQVMLISHHPEVIDYLATDTVFVFDRDSVATRARPLGEDERFVASDSAGLKVSEIIARGG